MSKYVNETEFYPDIITTNTRDDAVRYPLGTNNTLPAVPSLYEDNNDTTKTKDEAKKEYIKSEENIIQGDAKVRPTPDYKAKATIGFKGLGVLSGLYYVNKVTQVFDKSNGYEVTVSVSKNGVGNSIKSGVVSQPAPTPIDTDSSRPSSVDSSSSTRTYTVTSNDTLWGIAKYFYNDGSKYMTIYNANTSILSDPNVISEGMVLVIP